MKTFVGEENVMQGRLSLIDERQTQRVYNRRFIVRDEVASGTLTVRKGGKISREMFCTPGRVQEWRIFIGRYPIPIL